MKISMVRQMDNHGCDSLGPAVGILAFVLIVSLSILVLPAYSDAEDWPVTSAGRYKGWPNVPTMAEIGFPSVDMVFWVGLSGPRGLPANVVKTLDNAVREALSDPEVIAKLDKVGIEPFYKPGDAYRKFVIDEGEAIKALKLR